jgi:hypothetical protein
VSGHEAALRRAVRRRGLDPSAVAIRTAVVTVDLRTASEPVACHEHGTALSGFLPASWDHLGCQSWDHPACLAGLSLHRSLTRCVMSVEAEVVEGGIQGGQRG